MADRFTADQELLHSPAGNGEAATPGGADVVLANSSRAIYVGGAGNVAVTMAKSGVNLTFTGVPAGTLLPIRVTKVLLAGTTATGIIALN